MREVRSFWPPSRTRWPVDGRDLVPLTRSFCYAILRSPLDGAGHPPPVPPGGNGPLVHGEVVDLRTSSGVNPQGYEERLLPHPLPPGRHDVLSRSGREARARSRSVPRYGSGGLHAGRHGRLTERLCTLVQSLFSCALAGRANGAAFQESLARRTCPVRLAARFLPTRHISSRRASASS